MIVYDKKEANGKRCISLFDNPSSSITAIVSPGHKSEFNSSKAIIDPLGILGKKYFNAVLVGS